MKTKEVSLYYENSSGCSFTENRSFCPSEDKSLTFNVSIMLYSLHDWKIILGIGRVNNGNGCSLFGLFIRLKIVILFYRSPDIRQMSPSFQRVWETVRRRKRLGRRLHRLDSFNKVCTHLIWLYIYWLCMLLLWCMTVLASGFKYDLSL